MVRMALRGLLRPQAPHGPDRLRRRHRRRVRRPARSSSPTRSTRRSTDLFERVSKGVDVSVTAKQPVEGDFGGRIQPLPAGTFEKVEAAPTASRRPRRASRPRSRSSTRSGESIGGNGPPSIVFSSQRGALRPADLRGGRPGRRARRGHARQGDRGPARLRGRRRDADRGPRAGHGLRDRRDHEARRPELDRHREHDDAARRGAEDRAAARRRSPRSPWRPRAALARAAQGERSRARSAAAPRC